MSPQDLDALAATAARESLLAYAIGMIPTYECPPHLELLASKLEKVVTGEIKRLMVFMPPRHGKQVADSTPVLTTAGWKTHGELAVGDEVFGPDGRPAKVLALSGKTPSDVRVTLSDGSSVLCHENHEWTVFDRSTRGWRTVETGYWLEQTKFGRRRQIVSAGRSIYQLPEVGAIQMPQADLPVPPYVLGAWLGDGSSTKPCLTHAQDDSEVALAIEEAGYGVTAVCRHKATGVLTTYFKGKGGLTDGLRALGVMPEKHIPRAYKLSSVQQRLELLAGLIDTDGHVERATGRVRIVTALPRLRDDVFEVATSLGFRPYVTSQEPAVSTSGVVGRKTIYTVGFQPTMDLPTRLPRKRITRLAPQRRLGVVAVERVEGSTEVGSCIQVDRADGLYLVGRSLIPTHNSNLSSEIFPAWYLGHKPKHQVMFTTYGQDLADGFGRKVRNAVGDLRHVRAFPESILADDSKSAQRFNTAAGGVYYAVGAGGAVTGRGADCMVEGTLVQTAAGAVPVENLKVGAASGKILSLNQREMRLEYRELQAIASREADGLYRITTESGRVLEVTGNHRVFVGGEYREASSISPGDVVVCLLQEGLCKAGVSVPQEPESRACGQLLQQGVLGVAPRGQEHEALREVRESGEAEWRMQGRAILQGVQAAKSWAKNNIRAKAAELPDMRGWISGEVARWRAVCNLLRQALRGDRSLKADVGGLQPKVEGWRNPTAQAASFCESIQGDAPAHSGAGWESVCGVRGVGHQAGGASHRQLAHEQFRVEPSDAMRPLPQQVARGEGWQAQCDVVAVVERVRAKARVYDIQVEENQNLFANGVCVHNCLIIDDPLKNREEADSRLMRDKLWDWYASTAYTRLMPGGAVVLIQTRWHEDDLAGRLLNGEEQWEVVSLPAIAEPGDALGRREGEALWPARYDAQALERIRTTIGEREFTALYQQRPSPLDGALFRRDWIQRRKAPGSGVRIAMGVDLALSTKTSADYTAIVVMARDEFGKLYVLDAVRERVDFPGALRLIRLVADKWNPKAIAIEQVAYQAVVVQELLRSTTLPIKGVTPDRDKVTRAQPLALRYEQGLVFHEQLPSWFEDELLAFPQGVHDDAVDAAVYAYQAVMSMRGRDSGVGQVEVFDPFDPEMGT